VIRIYDESLDAQVRGAVNPLKVVRTLTSGAPAVCEQANPPENIQKSKVRCSLWEEIRGEKRNGLADSASVCRRRHGHTTTAMQSIVSKTIIQTHRLPKLKTPHPL
jgi:hypothetical protein